MSRNAVVLILGIAALLAAVAIVGMLTEHVEVAIGIGAALWGAATCVATVAVIGVVCLGRDKRDEDDDEDEDEDDRGDEPIRKRPLADNDEGPRTW